MSHDDVLLQRQSTLEGALAKALIEYVATDAFSRKLLLTTACESLRLALAYLRTTINTEYPN